VCGLFTCNSMARSDRLFFSFIESKPHHYATVITVCTELPMVSALMSSASQHSNECERKMERSGPKIGSAGAEWSAGVKNGEEEAGVHMNGAGAGLAELRFNVERQKGRSSFAECPYRERLESTACERRLDGSHSSLFLETFWI